MLVRQPVTLLCLTCRTPRRNNNRTAIRLLVFSERNGLNQDSNQGLLLYALELQQSYPDEPLGRVRIFLLILIPYTPGPTRGAFKRHRESQYSSQRPRKLRISHYFGHFMLFFTLKPVLTPTIKMLKDQVKWYRG